jgi:hypothetical protein
MEDTNSRQAIRDFQSKNMKNIHLNVTHRHHYRPEKFRDHIGPLTPEMSNMELQRRLMSVSIESLHKRLFHSWNPQPFKTPLFPNFIQFDRRGTRIHKRMTCADLEIAKPDFEEKDKYNFDYLPDVIKGYTLVIVEAKLARQASGRYTVEGRRNHSICVLFYRKTTVDQWEAMLYDSNTDVTNGSLNTKIGHRIDQGDMRSTEFMDAIGMAITGGRVPWRDGQLELHSDMRVKQSTIGAGICFVTSCVITLLMGVCLERTATSGAEVVGIE